MDDLDGTVVGRVVACEAGGVDGTVADTPFAGTSAGRTGAPSSLGGDGIMGDDSCDALLGDRFSASVSGVSGCCASHGGCGFGFPHKPTRRFRADVSAAS